LNQAQFRFAPLLEVIWIERDLHERALATFLAADSRSASFTDWSSFEAMRANRLEQAFTFDVHFEKYGFETLP
jgi:predicted nucleic acid-binding protein